MAEHSGQPQIDDNPLFGIDATALILRDNVAATASNLVFNLADSIRLTLRFELSGVFALPIVALHVPFTVQYFAEQLGGGNDVLLAAVNGNTAAGVVRYDDVFTTAVVALGPVLHNIPGT